MKKILVPTDFSEGSYNALLVAAQIAKLNNFEILLFHVLETYVTTHTQVLTGYREYEYSDEQKAYMAILKVRAEQNLQKLSEDEALKGLKVTAYTQEGTFHTSIIANITDKKVDLIVFGSYGASKLGESYRGNYADKVIHNANCPVLTIKQKTDFANVKNIIFATSLQDSADKAIRQVADFQNMFNANLHILRVNTPGNGLSNRKAQELYQYIIKENNLQNTQLHIYNEEDLESGIIHFSEDNSADLIMIGTHQRSDLMRIFSGASIAEGVATHTPIPVWTSLVR
jgi:nucleotide-binding universal stress UspA family protein